MTSETATRILEATYECLAEKGSANVTTRDISRASGVTLSLIHYYFPNKEKLLVASASYAIRREISALKETLLPMMSLEDRVFEAIHFIRNRFEHQDLKWRKVYFDLLSRAAWSKEIAEEVRGLQDELLLTIAAHSNAKFIPEEEIKAFSRVFLAALNGLALQYLHGTADEELNAAYAVLEKIFITIFHIRR